MDRGGWQDYDVGRSENGEQKYETKIHFSAIMWMRAHTRMKARQNHTCESEKLRSIFSAYG
jgi:hypothetical protein